MMVGKYIAWVVLCTVLAMLPVLVTIYLYYDAKYLYRITGSKIYLDDMDGAKFVLRCLLGCYVFFTIILPMLMLL